MKTHKNTARAALLTSGLLFGLVAATALTSTAEDTELDTGARAFPYKGTLMLDGAPYTGFVDLEVEVSDNANLINPNCQFVETHANVPVFSGAFRVNVGTANAQNNPINPCIFDAQAAFIQVRVRELDENNPNTEFVALGGSQRIRPVPFTYWTAESSDLHLDGDLRARGGLSAQSASVAIETQLGGGGSLGSLQVTNNLSNSGGLTLGNDNADTLTTNGPISAASIALAGDLAANGNLDLPSLRASSISGLDVINPGGAAVSLSSGFQSNSTTAPSLSITGNANAFSDFTIGDDKNLTVTGNSVIGDHANNDIAIVTGALQLPNCRVCIHAANGNGAQKGFACIKLIHGQAEFMRLSGDVNGDDLMGLSFQCDNVNSAKANVGAAQNWPHE